MKKTLPQPARTATSAIFEDRQTNNIKIIMAASRAIAYVEKTFGQEWILKELADAKKSEGRISATHGFILLWWQYYDWIDRAMKNDPVQNWLISEMIRLHQNLLKIKKVKNHHWVIERLKIKKQYYSALFEIEVAVEYLKHGFRVIFLPNETVSCPDFKVTKPGNEFYCECKSKALKDIVHWNELEKYLKKCIADGNKQLGMKKCSGVLHIKLPSFVGFDGARELLDRCEPVMKRLFLSYKNVTKAIIRIPGWQKKNQSRQGYIFRNVDVTFGHPRPRYPLTFLK